MLYRFFANNTILLTLISANALLIFVQGFFKEGDVAMPILEAIDHSLTLAFTLEAIVKIAHLGLGQYFKVGWNRFDFMLVLVALPSLLVWMTDWPFIELEFLLILRILRVFKFFRVLKFVPNVEALLLGILRAIKSSILIIFAFFIFNFIFAVLSYSLFAHAAPDHFGNPLLSFYTTFKIFTIEGWYEIPDLIAAESENVWMGIFTRMYFVLLLFGGGIFGLSLINSIFVESMMSDNNDEIARKLTALEDKMDRLLSQPYPAIEKEEKGKKD